VLTVDVGDMNVDLLKYDINVKLMNILIHILHTT